MAERNWDIELTNDAEKIRENLASGSVLCMVLNKKISARHLYNIVEGYTVFTVLIGDAQRFILLCGAYKVGGEFKKDTEKELKTFGRQVNEQIFDDLLHIGGTPYFPFCVDVDMKVVEKLREFFDIQEIEVNATKRIAVLGYYYDEKQIPSQEGRVVAELPPMLMQSPPILN